jgi:hypothetical protein
MTIGRASLTALIGLAIAALCATPFYFIGNRDPTNDSVDMGIVLLGLGAMLGLIILSVGLVMIAIRAFKEQGRILP